MAEQVIHPVLNGSRRIAKRRKPRLMCIDLTGDLTSKGENNVPTQYELLDVEDSCSMEYNGEQIQFNVRQLQHKFMLGRGYYGMVTLVQLEDRPDVCFACKRLILQHKDNNEYLASSDIKAMRTVDNEPHPNIIRFYAALLNLNEEELVICMEALERSMDQFYPVLHSQIHPSPEQLDCLIRRLAKHMVSALDYLQSKNITHRDVKPQNMLVNRQSIWKLCDFGISEILTDSPWARYTGSITYLSPERLSNVNSHGTRSNMWALGMSLLEISEGSHPMASKTILSTMCQIKTGWQPILPVTLAEDTRDLLSRLLRHDANERPQSYSEILSMPLLIRVTEKPSNDELMIVCAVLDALPPHTPE